MICVQLLPFTEHLCILNSKSRLTVEALSLITISKRSPSSICCTRVVNPLHVHIASSMIAARTTPEEPHQTDKCDQSLRPASRTLRIYLYWHRSIQPPHATAVAIEHVQYLERHQQESGNFSNVQVALRQGLLPQRYLPCTVDSRAAAAAITEDSSTAIVTCTFEQWTLLNWRDIGICDNANTFWSSMSEPLLLCHSFRKGSSECWENQDWCDELHLSEMM